MMNSPARLLHAVVHRRALAAVLAEVQPADGKAGLAGGWAKVSVLPSLTRMISAGCSMSAEHGVDFADEPGQIFRLVVKRDDDGKNGFGIHQAAGSAGKNRTPSMTLTREEIKTIQSPHLS